MLSNIICWLVTFAGWLESHNAAITTIATVVIAAFTVALACSTRKLWRAGERQARLTENQIALAREEFISTNRPRIILREAFTAPDRGHPVTIAYTLANTGGTKATIIDSSFCIEWNTVHGTKRQVSLDGQNVVGTNNTIEAGSHLGGSYAKDSVCWPQDPLVFMPGDKGTPVIRIAVIDWNYFFFGRVAYKDDNGIIRNMAFYRRLAGYTYQFVPIADPQLEYSDERP